jgi:chitin disaccharide deacetylase
MTKLLEALGRPADARLVIIVGDGLGSSHAANVAVYRALREGVVSSAGLMVPCPWARGAVLHHHGEDVGVSVTVNAEHDTYRWGPITMAPSLLDGDGGFPRTPADLWEHADVEEVRREARSQVERAVLWGFDITHLGAHLDALCSRPEFFDVLLGLAIEYDLPLALPDPSVDLGFPARSLAEQERILTPDRVVPVPLPRAARQAVQAAIEELEPGVTALHVRPAEDTPELRALTPDWAPRVSDAHLVTHDWGFRAALARSGAEIVGYRAVREAQRRLRR